MILNILFKSNIPASWSKIIMWINITLKEIHSYPNVWNSEK